MIRILVKEQGQELSQHRFVAERIRHGRHMMEAELAADELGIFHAKITVAFNRQAKDDEIRTGNGAQATFDV